MKKYLFDNGLTVELAPQVLFSFAVVVVLLFCYRRPVPRQADELPEQVSSDEEDIEVNERVEWESDILI